MKKKILSLIIAVLLLVPCFALGVSAASATVVSAISISDDYKTLVYHGDNYIRFDSSNVEYTYDSSFTGAVDGNPEISTVLCELSVNGAIITADIYFNDGSNLNADFINENYFDEYERLLYNADEYTVDLYYPEDNEVKIAATSLSDTATTLMAKDILLINDSFEANAHSKDGSFYMQKGALLLLNDQYYYVDYNLNAVEKPDEFYHEDYESLSAYKITDAQTVAELDKAYSEYNSDFVGLLGSDFTEGIATVFLSITFAVIPMAALIIFLILSIRAKAPAYKKLFTAISITAAIELVVFAVVVILLTV